MSDKNNDLWQESLEEALDLRNLIVKTATDELEKTVIAFRQKYDDLQRKVDESYIAGYELAHGFQLTSREKMRLLEDREDQL